MIETENILESKVLSVKKIMDNEPSRMEIGEKVFQIDTDKHYLRQTIYEGKCTRCGYDRITVTEHVHAGVFGARCRNCGFNHEL